MTTIRRLPPGRAKKGRGLGRFCSLLGILAVVVIAVHLFLVVVLFQKAPSSTENAPGGLRNAASSMSSVLARSRQALGQKKSVLKQPEPLKAPPVQKIEEQVEIKQEETPKEEKQKVINSKEAAEEQVKDGRINEKKEEKETDDKKEAKEETKDGESKQNVVEKEHENGANDAEQKDDADENEKGDRVTDVSYIADFLYRRNHPVFRNDEVKMTEVDPSVAKFERCEVVSGNQITTRAECLDEQTPLLIAFNAQPFPRTWCGKTIAPNSAEQFEKPCHEPVRLFPVDDPPITGDGMPPIIVTSSKGAKDLENVACDIPCQQEAGMSGMNLFIEDTDWKIIHTSDDPFYVQEARVERNAFRRDQYYSTTSFKSSVPLSFFSFDDYDLSTPAVDFDEALPSASYLLEKKCSSQGSKRHKWSGAVAAHYPVAHYGGCSHDTDVPEEMSLTKREDRIKIHSKHRFAMGFDASNEKDRITELVWDAFQSGSLPIVLGASNIEEHFPPNSFINCGRFQYWDQLAQHVKEVGENKTLWESYHTWRKDPDALKPFQERYNFTRTDPICRMCRWAYAKKYGLGWDHVQQEVRKTTLPRKLCVDSETLLVASPFFESYVTKTGTSYGETTKASNTESCDDGPHAFQGAFGSEKFQVERIIESHDGVTDLIFTKLHGHQTDGDFILRLEFGTKNTNGAYFHHPHALVDTNRGSLYSSVAIQDDKSKVTVIANWQTELLSTKEGTIEVVVHGKTEEDLDPNVIRRLRVIVEDTSFLHDKRTEFFPSTYGKLMTKDFVDPLELFTNSK